MAKPANMFQNAAEKTQERGGEGVELKSSKAFYCVQMLWMHSHSVALFVNYSALIRSNLKFIQNVLIIPTSGSVHLCSGQYSWLCLPLKFNVFKLVP